jgi:hypothetical protein
MTLRATGIAMAKPQVSTNLVAQGQQIEAEGAAGIRKAAATEAEREGANAKIGQANKAGNAQAGAAIGGVIGSIVPGIGTMIGAAVGGLIGGLFSVLVGVCIGVMVHFAPLSVAIV